MSECCHKVKEELLGIIQAQAKHIKDIDAQIDYLQRADKDKQEMLNHLMHGPGVCGNRMDWVEKTLRSIEMQLLGQKIITMDWLKD